MLHENKELFEQAVLRTSEAFGIEAGIVEKDYFVTLFLKEISKEAVPTVFKGGTSLSKCHKLIKRFSEDIDLTVFIEDCPTPSQAKKRLEKATLKFSSLTFGEVLENRRGSITCEYIYQSMYELDLDDSLQRFGKVKVEATSFTVSEPTTKIQIAPHLYELCSEERRAILREYYGITPFEIETISLERIFVDKVFATQFYYERKLFGDVAKHVYDMTVMLKTKQIQEFLKHREMFEAVAMLKRKEEAVRQGGVSAEMRIKDFPYFTLLKESSEFAIEFSKMQKIYVFNENDIIDINDALATIELLHSIL